MPSSNIPAISCHNLQLKIGERNIIDGVSLNIKSGEVTSLLGPNGAGKSTLLKILCGQQSTGLTKIHHDINYFGQPIKHWLKSDLAKHLAVLPQQSSLSFAFTVKEVVALGLLPLSLTSKNAQEIILKQCREVGIEHLQDRLYPTLSGGEQQRVHLARVLAQLSQSKQKTILMLDEPTAALDLKQQHNTLQLAKRYAQAGAAVIIVLHDLNLAAQYSDRIIILDKGRIQVNGTPWDTLSSEVINNIYGHQTHIQKHPLADYPVIYAS